MHPGSGNRLLFTGFSQVWAGPPRICGNAGQSAARRFCKPGVDKSAWAITSIVPATRSGELRQALDHSQQERLLDAPRCARFPPVKRTVAAVLSIWALMLVAAPAAFAEEGVGLAGPTTDKTVTFFCFGVIAFFAALVIVLSLIQGRMEQRKEMRKQTLQRLG